MIAYHFVEVVFLAVSSIIFLEGSHQNHADQTNQENDHHERVEDGEPVNLHNNKNKTLMSHRIDWRINRVKGGQLKTYAMLEKVGVEIFIESVFKQNC